MLQRISWFDACPSFELSEELFVAVEVARNVIVTESIRFVRDGHVPLENRPKNARVRQHLPVFRHRPSHSTPESFIAG